MNVRQQVKSLIKKFHIEKPYKEIQVITQYSLKIINLIHYTLYINVAKIFMLYVSFEVLIFWLSLYLEAVITINHVETACSLSTSIYINSLSTEIYVIAFTH